MEAVSIRDKPDIGPIGRALDAMPLGWLHGFIVLTMGLGLIFDTLEASMTNVLATVFSSRAGVTPHDLSLLLVAVFVGGAVGAPLAGHVSDRLGRRKTLLGALIGYAAMSFMAAYVTDLKALSAIRLAGGFFLAAYPPLLWTYLAEVLPPRRRGRLMMFVGAAGSLGSAFAPILSRSFDGSNPFGLEGWQAAFAFGGVGGLMVAAMTLFLPESPRWLERKGRLVLAEIGLARFAGAHSSGIAPPREPDPAVVPTQRPSASIAGKVDRGPDFGKRLALLLVLQFLQPIAVIGFVVLSGVVLAQKGHDVHSSLLYVGVAALGAPVGAILAAFVIDRFPRHLVYSGCAVIMAVLGIVFAVSTSPSAAMASGMAYMIVVVIFSMTLSIYGPEMFVTEIRGFAAGAGYSANRLGAAMVPLALLPVLLATSATIMFGVIAGSLILSAILICAFGPRHVAGRALR